MDLSLGDLRATLAGFLVAVVVLLVLFWAVGFDRILAALSMAEGGVIVLVALVALAWLTAWSLALRTVLGVLGIAVSVKRAFLVFAGATFANNTTPFGQAGGEPFSALLISRATDSEYETGLAAIASVDALNFLPSIVLSLIGIGYYATVFTLGRRLELAALAILALALLVPIVVALGWRHRTAVKAAVVRLVTPAARWLARLLPGVSPPEPATIERRIDGFFGAIERVGRSRRGLLAAVGFSTLGWLLLSTSLWLSLYSLGHAVPVAAVLLVVPVGSIAGVTPLPGGLGGVEAALILLIVPTTGVGLATATAAAVVHRGATYWLPVLVGAGAVGLLEGGNATPERWL